jgi:hypothetical protein
VPLLLLLLSAQAHVGDLINGIDVAPSEGSELPPVEASYGLLLPGDGGWDWVCHEAITAPDAVRSPRYARGPDGVWLGWVADRAQGRGGETLFRSDDACGWADVAVAGAGVVTGAAWTDAGALAVTRDPGAVLASVDGGRQFEVVVPEDPLLEMTSVLAGGGAAWAAGVATDGRSVRVWVDEDGAGLIERDVPLPPTVEPPIPTARLLTVDGPTAVLVLAPSGADTALRTDDGGRSWAVAYEAAGAIVDAALDGPATWLVLDGARLVRVDGLGGVTESPDFPRSLGISSGGPTPGIATAEGELWAAPQSSLEGPMLSRSTGGGQAFETVAWPDDIRGTLACPSGSDVATVCEPLWDTLLPRIRGFDSPLVDTADTGGSTSPGTTGDSGGTPTPPVDGGRGGCGCGGGAGAGWLGVGLAAMIRRRER